MKQLSTFLLSVVSMMCISLIFTSCKDDEEADISVKETNTVIIDGVVKPIFAGEIDNSDLARGYYDIILFLSEDKIERVRIMADDLHHDGRNIDLSQEETEHEGWYWAVQYVNAHNIRVFATFGQPNSSYPIFQQGTLFVKRTGFGSEFEVRLKDGKLKVIEPNEVVVEHTISLNFKGILELNEILSI